MKTPAITLLCETTPEAHLTRTVIYTYHPLAGMKEQVIQGVKDHLKSDLTEFDAVDVRIEVVLKQYGGLNKKSSVFGKPKPNEPKNP